MVLLRRLALMGSMLICVSISFTAAAIATEAHIAAGNSIQGKGGPPPGGGLPPAGKYTNTNVFAGYSLCCSGPQLTVNVSDMTNTAHPKVGAATSLHEVDVNLQACDFVTGICGAGCFIPDRASDWTFSANLSSAALKTTVTPSTLPCQGSPVTGLLRPFTVSVTWTATGSRNTSSGTGRYACSGYKSETVTKTSGNTAVNATASTSLFSGTFPASNANLNSFDQRIHAQGTPLDSCSPLGGKGAGFGPLVAGKYHLVSKSANLTIPPADPSQSPINMFVTTFTNTSSPKGGTTTTLSETDLNIFEFAFPQIIQDCFIIPSSAFTIASNLHGASVHVSIDPTTKPCPQGNNSGLPASFTVNVTWSGTGPIASLRTDGTSQCGNFRVASSGTESTINAIASGGLSGIADSFSTTQASMSTSDTTTRVTGQQTCF
jgi:hypothetical protein